jgi:TonB family protein
MNAEMLWSNLRMYSLQITLLIGVAAAVPVVLRLRMPRAKLLFWHAVLAACLALPLMRPPQRAVVTGSVEVSTTVVDVRPAVRNTGRQISTTQAILLALGVGAMLRLGWLGIGLWRLRRYRLKSRPAQVDSRVDIRLSGFVSSPVTFGVRNPVVLLPESFPELDAAIQRAILCHELLHVERRDWLFTVGEEVIRAVFWFHPAIWWLLGEIGLAREQEVDRLVVERTRARESYVDALLAIAGVTPQLDLAPAPLFLRKRHLKQRVVSILKEAAMSKKRWISALAAGLGVVAAACWVVTATLPLTAAPQVVNDGAGVTVDTGGAALMHRAPVNYPAAARSKGVQGTVVVQARTDSSGNVVDAQVMTGPDELRRAALESVLQWHFAGESAGSTRQVSITFRAPAGSTPVDAQAGSEAMSAPPRKGAMPRFRDPAWQGTVSGIVFIGLSDQARNDLASRLPLHEGETANADSLQKLQAVVHDFDEHLAIGFGMKDNTQIRITISNPGSMMRYDSMTATPNGPVASTLTPPVGGIKVAGDVQQANLVEKVTPVYPQLAKQARISGIVHLEAIIGKDGSVLELKALPGSHPLLIPAAIEAVKQWKYKPTLLNGEPVEVVTTIEINFTLTE